MRLSLRLSLVMVCLSTMACGSDPDQRTADWEDHSRRSREATAAGRHDEAMAIAEAYLERHPDNVDGHGMVADAAAEAARATDDASRVALLERAATHYERSFALSKNSLQRLIALAGLVNAYGSYGLDRPTEAERWARQLIAEDPGEVGNYNALVSTLAAAKKFDAVVELLADARKAMRQDAESVATYATIVHDTVLFTPGFPPDTGSRLLAEASTQIEQALAQHGATERLLRVRDAVLKALAERAPEAAR